MLGKIVTVIAEGQYDLCIDNDLGGTVGMPPGTYSIQVTKTFYDYETGRRGIGLLVKPEDIETARKVGTTEYEPKKKGWNPAKCFFDMGEVER